MTWGGPHFRVGDKILAGYGEQRGMSVISFKRERKHAAEIIAIDSNRSPDVLTWTTRTRTDGDSSAALDAVNGLSADRLHRTQIGIHCMLQLRAAYISRIDIRSVGR